MKAFSVSVPLFFARFVVAVHTLRDGRRDLCRSHHTDRCSCCSHEYPFRKIELPPIPTVFFLPNKARSCQSMMSRKDFAASNQSSRHHYRAAPTPPRPTLCPAAACRQGVGVPRRAGTHLAPVLRDLVPLVSITSARRWVGVVFSVRDRHGRNEGYEPAQTVVHAYQGRTAANRSSAKKGDSCYLLVLSTLRWR